MMYVAYRIHCEPLFQADLQIKWWIYVPVVTNKHKHISSMLEYYLISTRKETEKSLISSS